MLLFFMQRLLWLPLPAADRVHVSTISDVSMHVADGPHISCSGQPYSNICFNIDNINGFNEQAPPPLSSATKHVLYIQCIFVTIYAMRISVQIQLKKWYALRKWLQIYTGYTKHALLPMRGGGGGGGGGGTANWNHWYYRVYLCWNECCYSAVRCTIYVARLQHAC